MQRIIGLAVAAMLVSSSGEAPAAVTVGPGMDIGGIGQGAPSFDVSALLTSARGAPPMICALAAQSMRRWGWNGDWDDAPSTPLRSIVSAVNDRLNRNSGNLPAEDIDRLMAGLASDDPCVRELSVRLLGTQKGEPTSGALVARLASNDASLREVAALGLGFIEPVTAISPLIRALGDQSPGVRANSAWALGRIEDGRALRPLVALFDDAATMVREAAVVAVGQMESTATVAALIRVVRQDNAPSVRRVAAWALGNIESRDAVQELSRALGQDADARVREMSAWALGNIRGQVGHRRAPERGTARRRRSRAGNRGVGAGRDRGSLVAGVPRTAGGK